jgi:hypothetical protein
MSEPKKYVTFRDLKDLPAKDEPAQPLTNTSTSSATSIPSATSISSTPNIFPEPVSLNQPKFTPKKGGKPDKQNSDAVAPERDFQRVPNSVTRTALPDGVFRGKSKQVWDYLWSVSRGAVVPKRSVRKARKEIKAGAGLGSMVTVDAAIEHLQMMGLLSVKPAIGSLAGNEYEVFTPEESSISATRYTSISSIPSTTSPTQNLVQLDILESSTTSTTLSPLNSTESGKSNTSFNTHDDDTHTLLGEFTEALMEAAQGILGKPVPNTEKERELWRECGCVLADELKKAAARTESVSSVPAFFASHLRRRFTKSAPDLPVTSPDAHSSRPRDQKSKALETPSRVETHASKFSLEECRRYADHLHKSGQGINNPGGYATMVYRSGEADTLIEKFLNPGSADAADLAKCPDCRGTGFIYPEGIERGVVAKCKHRGLPIALTILTHVEQLRSLHSTEEGYGLEALKEDLQYRCQRDGLEWDEQLIDWLLAESS